MLKTKKTKKRQTQISHTQLLYTKNDRTDQFDNCEESATKPSKKKEDSTVFDSNMVINYYSLSRQWQNGFRKCSWMTLLISLCIYIYSSLLSLNTDTSLPSNSLHEHEKTPSTCKHQRLTNLISSNSNIQPELLSCTKLYPPPHTMWVFLLILWSLMYTCRRPGTWRWSKRMKNQGISCETQMDAMYKVKWVNWWHTNHFRPLKKKTCGDFLLTYLPCV